MPDTTRIEGVTWGSIGGLRHYLVVEPTDCGDGLVTFSVYDVTGDGPGVQLNTEQVRGVIGDLAQRAHLAEQSMPPVDYFVAEDGGGDVALWRGTGSDEPRCECVARKCELDRLHPILWPTLVAALVTTSDAVDGA